MIKFPVKIHVGNNHIKITPNPMGYDEYVLEVGYPDNRNEEISDFHDLIERSINNRMTINYVRLKDGKDLSEELFAELINLLTTKT